MIHVAGRAFPLVALSSLWLILSWAHFCLPTDLVGPSSNLSCPAMTLTHPPHGDSRPLCNLVPKHLSAQGVAISALAGGGNTPNLLMVNLAVFLE